ncbi:MAG: 50S ribosomal protein L24e [Candidatus Thermoplasmatota archaeon]
MDKKTCSFCGIDIEPGTGKMYVKKDGTKWNFCSNKCKKNLVDLKRVNRNVKWTAAFEKGAGPTPPNAEKAAKKAKKVPAAPTEP